MAFVSSPSSTNEVNTAYGVSTANTQVSPASTQVSTVSTQVSTANLSDDTVYAFLANQPNGSQLVYEDFEQIHEDDIEEMDLKWQLALLSMRTRRFFQKTGRKITINRSDTAGYDKSKLDDLRIEFNKSEFNLATYKRGLASVKEQLVFDKKNESQIPDKSRKGVEFVSYNTVPPPPTGLFSTPKFDLSNSGLEEFQQPEFEGYEPKLSKSFSEDISNEVRESPDAPLIEELVSDDKLEKKTVFPTVVKIEFVRPKEQEKPVRKPVKYTEMYSFDHVQAHCNYHQRERVVSGNSYTRVNYNYSAKKTHPSAHRNMVPRAVLMKTGLRSLNTARPKAVNTARPNSAVVNAVRENQGHLQKEDQGYVDSGCSRHMTWNMSYISDFKEFDEGYVTFGGRSQRRENYCVLFTDTRCFVLSSNFKLADESHVLLKVHRKNNMYIVDMKNIVPKESLTCLVAKATLDESMLWHRRLGHVNDQTCVACLKGKFTLVFFLASKDETSGILKNFITEIENQVDKKVKIIRCDNGTEFKNRIMSEFCKQKGIKREFSVARTPQQNGVTKRRNRTLIEATRTMLADSKLPSTFWVEVVNTTCYVQNKVLIVKPHNKTPYELFRGRTPALSFMRPFRCHVTILNTLDYLGKFDRKSDEGFFVRYSLNSKAFRVYNIKTRKVEENLHIRFLEDKPIIIGDEPKWLFDIDVLTKSMNYVPVVAGTNSNDLVGTEESIGAGHSSKETGSNQDYILMPLWKDGSLFNSSLKNSSNDEPQPSSDAGKKDDEGVCKKSRIADFEKSKNSIQGVNTAGPSINTEPETCFPLEDNAYSHTAEFFVMKPRSGVLTRRMTKTTNEQGFICAVYEGKTHEDLHTCLFACFLSQEETKKVWTLMDLPHGKRAIGTKWVYMNKKDERVARIEAIRLFLAYASFKDFIVYQMDVKSAFLYGKIEKEVYVCQPLGFEDPEFPDRMLCTEFEKLMHKKFQMSSMGELTFFLRLQVIQKDDGIFINQDKYVDEILKKFVFSTVKTASTPMETSKPLLKDAEAEDVDVHLYRSMIGSLIIFRYLKGQPKLGLWYPKDSPFDLEAYIDGDYVGASLDRKSTTGGCQFLGSRLISWQCKKQTIVANSTTEAEYVAAASCCGQNGTTANDEIQVSIVRLTFYCAKTTAWNEFSSTMASAIICLATNQKFNFSKYIFDNMVKNLEGGVKFLMYPRFVQVFLDKQVEGMTKHKEIYVTPSHTKKVFANMKREGKGFSGRVTPLFETMMVQAPEELGEGSKIPTDPQHTPTIIQPSTSQPQKKQPRRKQRKDTEVPQPSGSTEPITDEAANEEHVPVHSNDLLLSGEDRLKLNELMELCTNLSQRVLDLENTKTSQAVEITKLKERVKKLERRNKSRTLGLKRLRKGRKIADLDADAEVTLVDEAQERNDDNLMFDTGVLDEQEVEVEKVVSTAEVTTVIATTTTVDELTLAQTLIKIKAAKPKAVTTAATTTTTDVTRPKARGVVVQESSEFRTTTSSSHTSQLPQAKDKGKAKMIEPGKPLKKKYQILIDEEIDYELAQRLQAKEQGELTIEERLKLLVELMDKRKKHFAKLRAEEIRRKPPTKAQKRNQMCTYLKNMANYKHRSKSQAEGSKKRTRKEIESDNSKKQKIDENVEAKVDDEA
ncbi:ribonuclease H-like domain-containing protein [Tanacetum coccineum]